MAPPAVAVSTMQVAQVPKPGARIPGCEREIPEPQAGHVRIKQKACAP